MVYGYTGKIAFINLTDSTITVEERSEDFYRKTLGGEGIGAWLINEKVPHHADPLGPENGLCISTGILTESRAPSSPRVMVMTKSPLTGGFGDSNAGGAFGPELKRCGFDALYIYGIAEKPVYISVTNDLIEIKDAAHLTGKDTVETKDALIEEYNDPKIKVASIGVTATWLCPYIDGFKCRLTDRNSGHPSVAHSGIEKDPPPQSRND